MNKKEEIEFEQVMKERDYWEEKATELAVDIGEHFGYNVGEHSSDNCPVTNAIDLVYRKR